MTDVEWCEYPACDAPPTHVLRLRRRDPDTVTAEWRVCQGHAAEYGAFLAHGIYAQAGAIRLGLTIERVRRVAEGEIR